MDRIIEVQVSGSYVAKDNQTAGWQGEANATFLRIQFDEGWDGYAKTITWWDARGENPTPRLLTADALENLPESTRIYLTPIPGEALAVWGKCMFGIDGYVNGKRVVSAYSQMVVKPNGDGADVAIEDPTPTQAQQLQAQIDTLLADIQWEATSAVRAAGDASDSAETAQNAAAEALASALGAAASETAAKVSETKAAASEKNAAGSERAAQEAASWAQAQAERMTVPAAVGVYNTVLTDRVTGEKYALVAEAGALKLLGVSGDVDAVHLTLIDQSTGTAYDIVVENGYLSLEEV